MFIVRSIKLNDNSIKKFLLEARLLFFSMEMQVLRECFTLRIGGYKMVLGVLVVF